MAISLPPTGDAPARPLETLAADINQAHQDAQAYAAKAIDRALHAGDMLNAVKARLPHGEFGPWCERNLPAISRRTLQNYMRVARELPAEKRTDAYLTLNEALRLIAGEPEPDTLFLFLDEEPSPTLCPMRATPVAVSALIAGMPAEERRAVIDLAVASDGLKTVAATDQYLHVSQSRYEWYTPAEYLDAAREVMGAIDLDPASCEFAQATVKAGRYYTKEHDGLTQPWHGRVWLNPPYEAESIRPFIKKLIDEYLAGKVSEAIVLTENATDTGWFHALARVSAAFCFTRGRIKFYSPLSDSRAPIRGHVLTYLAGSSGGLKKFCRRFADTGLIVQEMPS